MVNFFRRETSDKSTIRGEEENQRVRGSVRKKDQDHRFSGKEMVPGAIATNNPYPTSSKSNMAGYSNGAPTPMDGYHNNKHYSFSSNGQASPTTKTYQSRESRSGGGQGRRSRSTRSGSKSRSSQQGSSSGHNSNSHYSNPQTPMGATNAPPDGNMQHQYHQPQAPMTQYDGEGGSAAVTPSPPPDLSNYPPHVSSSQSQGSAATRRPAYLLHRDLVIGKGSYGQVCIASRGESEGHTSSGAGKRKKFACKCVVLRNDAKYIAKLQEEVNVLRELRGHENVIRLYDVFCVDNELFIITELGRGGDLFHLLTTHPKHGVTEAYAGKFYVSQTLLISIRMLHSLLKPYTFSQNRFSDVIGSGFSSFTAYLSPRPQIRKLGA